MDKQIITNLYNQIHIFTKVPKPLNAHPRNGKLENSASAATCGSCNGLGSSWISRSFRVASEASQDLHDNQNYFCQGSFEICLVSDKKLGNLHTKGAALGKPQAS